MTEKNYRYFSPGGGVFSRFLQCGIIPLADVDFDNVYLIPSHFGLDAGGGEPGCREFILEHEKQMREYGIANPYEPLFNYFLDQKCDSSYEFGGFLPVGTLYKSTNKIEESPRFQDYRRVLRRLRFKNTIIKDIENRSAGIDWNNTLGVHLRLTTMVRHWHDIANFEIYLRLIERTLREGNYSSIFVASDNDESAMKLQHYFGSMVKYNADFHRIKLEDDTDITWEFKHYFKNYYWTEAIIDAMMLSQARALICRTSNFSNAAIVFGNYENIVRL